MKTELISARLPREAMVAIEERAADEKIDKTTALKQLLLLGSKQWRLEKAVKLYQLGKISTGKAAKVAGVSLWEMMDELKRRNIPSSLTKNEYLQGLKNLEEAWR